MPQSPSSCLTRRPLSLRVTAAVCSAAVALGLVALSEPAHADDAVAVAEQAFLDATNAARGSQGLPALAANRTLAGIARDWSGVMAGRADLAHNPAYREQYPFTADRMGENVGYGRYPGGTPQQRVELIQNAFLGSSGHLANIVGDYNQVGIGVAIAGETMWVTLDFLMGPSEPAPAPGPEAPAVPLPEAVPPAALEPAPPVAGPDPAPPFAGEPEADPQPVALPAPAQVGEAVGVSRELFENGGATHAVVARADAFADALGGAALAGGYAPVLLTPGPTAGEPNPALDPAVAAEVDRVLDGGGTVYLLGGTAAVSQASADALDAAGYQVVRLAGASRVETAVAVADEVVRLHGDPETVLLARAEDWADAVAGGAWAADAGAPVLLTDRAALHPATAAFLADHDGTDVFALGGSAALAEEVVDAARATRVAGRDRVETAVAIAADLWGRTAARDGDRFVLTPGYHPDGWAYALAYAPLSARRDAPQLLVGSTVPAAVADYLADAGYGDAQSAELDAASAVPSDVVGTLRGLVAS